MKEPIGIYVHIPFCMERCIYCDFLTFPHLQAFHGPYVQALVEETQVDAKRRTLLGREVDSVFIGGGTPSILEADQIQRIFARLNEVISLSPDAEITMEANPDSLDEDLVKTMAKLGVNRVSLGIQTTNEDLLRMCNRTHDLEDIVRALSLLEDYGIHNINFDFILGLPGQSLEDIKKDLEWVQTYQPNHISWYSLIVEDRTMMKIYLESGELEALGEDKEVEYFQYIKKRLAEMGYQQYENSNFALENYESKHNLKYWSAQDYWGLGLGASSHIGGERTNNTSSMQEYLSAAKSGEKTWTVENRSREDDLFEQIMMGLRKKTGIHRPSFIAKNNFDLLELGKDFFDQEKQKGMVDWNSDYFYLTDQGFLYQNDFLSDFLLYMERKK